MNINLWIRSQNRERLRLPDNLRIYQEEGQIDFNIQDSGCILGTYKTKERALEVLDEIEGLLVLKQGLKLTTNAIYSVDNGLAIYEMPKD